MLQLRKLPFIILITSAIATVGCSAHRLTPEMIGLESSFKSWKAAEAKTGGNYSYTVRRASAFGFGNETKLFVKSGSIIQRSYSEFGQTFPVLPQQHSVNADSFWTERGADLSQHGNQGALVRTIDQLYAECRSILQSTIPVEQKLNLGYGETGFLAYCFTHDPRIMDDAPMTGVSPFTIDLGSHPE